MAKDRNYLVSNLIFTFYTFLAIFLIGVITTLVFKFVQLSAPPIKEVRLHTFFLTTVQIVDFDTVLREKREFLSYVFCAIFGSSIIFLSLFFCHKKLSEKLAQTKEIYLQGAVIFFAVLSLIGVLELFAEVESMFVSFPRFSEKIVAPMIWLSIVLMSLIVAYQASKTEKLKLVMKIFFIVVVLGLSLFVVSFWIFDEYSMSPKYSGNFDPVVYPIVQQYLGKELLIDSKSLYGLHPYFLQFVLYVFPKTVLTLSLVMATLFLVSLLALAVFIYNALENKLLAIVGFVALIYLQNFSIDSRFRINELAFQYEAIRLFFPCLLLGFSWFFYQNPSQKKYYWALIFFALATIWNLDTGLPTFMAAVVMLGYENLKNQFSWKTLAQHLAKSFAILATIWLGLTLFLKIKYGQWPNFSWMVYGQSAAADFGYAMLPITSRGIWQIVVLIYAIGLIFSIDNFVNKKHSPQNSSILLLTILGVGLFTYDIGRSHPSNVIHCGYPALLLLIIFADKFCKNLVEKKFIWQNKIPRIDLLLLSLPLFMISYFCVVLFFEIPLNKTIKEQSILTKFPHGAQPYWIDEMEFIKQHIGMPETKSRDDVLMLSIDDYGYYFDLELHTKSSLNVVNLRHMFYQEDLDSIYNLIVAQDKKWVVLIEPKTREVCRLLSDAEMLNLKEILNRYYKINATMPVSEIGGVTIFEKK